MLLATLSYPRIDPVVLSIGPLHIRWYGIAYLCAFAAAFAVLRRLSRKGVLCISPEATGDLVSWLAAGVVIGGRLGWWLFYHRDDGAAEPWYEPLAIWHGGMSFHGGLIGVAAALFAWARSHRAPFLNVADGIALAVPIGLFFGRIANFINAELVGRPTSLPWGMIFPGDTVARHPSQLYEAVLEGPLLFLMLLIVAKRPRRRDGLISALFLIFYGVFRFGVEFTRQPDSQLGFIAFGWLTMGQLLSFLLAVVGIVQSIWALRQNQSSSSMPVISD